MRSETNSNTNTSINTNSETYTVSGYADLSRKNREQPPARKVPSSWVAEILGWELSDTSFSRFTRKFLRERTLEWLSKPGDGHSRGIKKWLLPGGLYECQVLPSQAHAETVGVADGDRFFLQVQKGEGIKIDRETLERSLGPIPETRRLDEEEDLESVD